MNHLGSQDYWVRALQGLTTATPLVIDQRLPRQEAQEPCRVAIRLSSDETRRLRMLASREKVGLESVVRTAWAILLGRYNSETDVVFGSTVSDHGRNGNRPLPFRVKWDPSESSSELLRRIEAQAREMGSHLECSSEDIRNWLAFPKDVPLFYSMLLFAEPGDSVLPLEELKLLLCSRTGEQLELEAIYDAVCLDGGAVLRMLGHIRALLESMACQPTMPTAELELLTSQERHQLLSEWNSEQLEFPREKCIHQLFEETVEEFPDVVAVVCGTVELTYRELNHRSNQLARHLKGLGVANEDLVGVFMDRSVDMVVGLLGVLKAGAAYVPLDPAYPEERIRFMLHDAGVDVVLTERKLAELLPEGSRGVALDSEEEAIGVGNDEPLSCTVSSSSLSHVIYTSGSTGTPKGVAIEHRNVVALLSWAKTVYAPEELRGTLASTSICFDLSVFEIFVPLCSGGTVILAGNVLELPSLPAAERVTLINAVPSAIAELVRGGAIPSSVRTVNLAGEPLRTELVQDLYRRGIEKVYDLYGPSEDTTYSTFSLRSSAGPETIGRPIANTQVYILDAGLQPLPVGVPGEVYIGGAGVSRGYLHRPELTAERYLADPFKKETGGKLYRTGDLGFYFPDGNIRFLGRIDHQVKIRGFRIELGEIETVLRRHSGIQDAVVTVREDTPGVRQLAAYLVAANQRVPSVSELRVFLGQRLPDYMVPSVFVPITALPRTPNGKVDRAALPEPTRERPSLEQAYVGPRTDIEKLLTRIWSSILTLDRVGIHDRFFELGGDSILAAQVINSLQQELGESLFIVSMFEAPTVAEFARFLERRYPEAIARLFKTVPSVKGVSSTRQREGRRIDESALQEMRRVLPSLSQSIEVQDEDPRNASAIFILAPPRSGTTLLRMMLAGHPALFACSELQLLGFNTLQERKSALAGKYSLWLDGTVRAIMEITRCDAETAKRTMESFEEQGLTSKQFYRVLQEWIRPRMLVEKTPFYALDIETLRKAERDFQNPLYVHLVRHPSAMVRSFENQHMDQVLRAEEHSFSGREVGELVWTISHQNILEFLNEVPKSRHYRICFEELVTRPQSIMEQMCRTLNLEFHSALLEPYRDQERKMIDGVHAVSTPMDDRNFQRHGRINPEVAGLSKCATADDRLGEVTRTVMRILGYGALGSQYEGELRGTESKTPSRHKLRAERRRRRLSHREERLGH